MLPIEDILLAPSEERDTTPDEAPQIQDESVIEESEQVVIEEYHEKPTDENSDPLPNKNLTDEEIAQLILDEEEVLNEKGVLGINFKKLRPRVPLLKESKVLQELQKEIESKPEQENEVNRQSTFLQKPERPVPLKASPTPTPDPEPYRVVIKKQPKKPVIERLVEKGLIPPSELVKIQENLSQVKITSENPTAPQPDLIPPKPLSQPPTTPLPQQISNNISRQRQLTIVKDNPVETSTMASPIVRQRPRLCRRGKYGSKCLMNALESLNLSSNAHSNMKRPSAGNNTRIVKARRLPRKGHYFQSIVKELENTLSSAHLVVLASLACALKESYNAEILHRGSSRRNSRRMSAYRRDSITVQKLAALAEAASHTGPYYMVKNGCYEGRRRLSSMSMVVAEKVQSTLGHDWAKAVACALVPCATALAFFLYNHVKRYND